MSKKGKSSAPCRPGRCRRAPRKATPEMLRKSALRYLERYAASAAHLRRILLAKVERSARAHGTDRADGAAAVDDLIADLVTAGLLDDARFAEHRAHSLHRRGASGRAIRAALLAKGVARDLVERALAGLAEEAADPDLAAALAFARRRRLGPYRAPEVRAAFRKRDLAALGRQGFDYDLARRVVETDDPDSLEEEARVD